MVTKQPVLIMIQGPEPGSVYKLPDNRVTTVGRSSRNTICTVSASVSRFHCEVSWVNGCWELNDLNSKRGTFVNGERIIDRWELTPGDIIRASSTMFRFDMIDENALKDGAIVAIMEAGLDQKLDTKKGGGVGSLDDIRERSRLEAEHARQGRRSGRRRPLVNRAFLAVVAAATVIIVGALLFLAHRQTGAPGRRAVRRAEAAQAIHRKALADMDAGRYEEGAQKLRRLATEYANTVAGAQAESALEDALWTVVDLALSRIDAAAPDEDFAAAINSYRKLAQHELPDHMAAFAERRRAYTVRLAHAHFKHVDQAAQRRLEQGDPNGAMRLYRQVRKRIGVSELQELADSKIRELEQ